MKAAHLILLVAAAPGEIVLYYGLVSLTASMRGQLPGDQEPDGALDIPGGDGGPLIVVCQLAGLSGYSLKQVQNKGVHDLHCLG